VSEPAMQKALTVMCAIMLAVLLVRTMQGAGEPWFLFGCIFFLQRIAYHARKDLNQLREARWDTIVNALPEVPTTVENYHSPAGSNFELRDGEWVRA